jgi:hypothetical protein
MADNNYRSYRSHDPVLPGNAEALARGPQDDPLAELARLIGQSDSTNDDGHGSTLAHDDVAPADGADWAADDNYVGPSELAEDNYDARDPYPQHRADPPAQSRDYRLPAAAPVPRFNGTHDDAPGYAVAPPRYRDEQVPPESFDRPLPAFLPRMRDDRYEYDDQDYAGSDPQYLDDDEEAPSGRRGGLVVVAAVLSLAVLGTAGAFAYRAMFGGSMLPSLPPIIRADNGPTKIMPGAGNLPAGNSDQATATGPSSGDKLVPREETPLAIPQQPGAAPRVVSTIPIFPDPTPGPPSGMTPGAAPASVGSWPAAPTNSPAPQGSPQYQAQAATPTPSAAPGTRVIHTVPIRSDQTGGTTAAAAPPPVAQAAPVARAVVQHPVKSAPPAPAGQADANAPLSIVPNQGGQAPAAPARVPPARARPPTLVAAASAAPAAAGGGGYAVQVSSQRSQADAQAEFRALQAKFPNQLAGHQPMVRRADLGDKGIYYRAMVGPYASMEQAAQMCLSLKAAGGSCIVQKD